MLINLIDLVDSFGVKINLQKQVAANISLVKSSLKLQQIINPNSIHSCDIFCRVIDNYGDAAVCWRLAKQLACEFNLLVRLWINDLETLKKLEPTIVLGKASQLLLPNLRVNFWNKFSKTKPADIVIETFACELPKSYIDLMALQAINPVWINLEYLSYETWVDSFHCLPSIQNNSLTKYCFFPGDKGGLLREYNYYELQQDWKNSKTIKAAANTCTQTLCVSLFTYHNTALPSLLNQWIKDSRALSIHCLAFPGPNIIEACNFFEISHLLPGQYINKGNLCFEAAAFVPQNQYDFLLWNSDLNFVRGEDSFVRAQLTGKPMIWHIYPQTENTHLVKLAAFAQKYSENLSLPAKKAWTKFQLAWNLGSDCAKLWDDLMDHLEELNIHAQFWAKHLSMQKDLAKNLMEFAHNLTISNHAFPCF